LDVFTRHHGRIALAARGAKRPTSNFRPILLPLQLLHINFGGDAEIRNLRSAEWQGGHVMPTGDMLLSGYYLNELLMRLLARDDPHPALFDAYAAATQWLAGRAEPVAKNADAATHGNNHNNRSSSNNNNDVLQMVLRAFELHLLRGIGLLPRLDRETATQQAVVPEGNYLLQADCGLRAAHADDRATLPGRHWLDLQQALEPEDLDESGDHDSPPALAEFAHTVQACLPGGNALKRQLRAVLHYHCGVSTLKTRQMMLDLQGL
jgi:DNA repair protein RecO (recombination protein O)